MAAPRAPVDGGSTTLMGFIDDRSPDGGERSRPVVITGRTTGRLGNEGQDDAERRPHAAHAPEVDGRSEEHTSELQSLAYLVCRLLLEKKKKTQYSSDVE